MPIREICRRVYPQGYSKVLPFKVMAWSLLGALYASAGGALPALANEVAPTPNDDDLAPRSLAQVPNTDLACFLHGMNGRAYDLSSLCGGYDPAAQTATLKTGDVQVTLRWDTPDDLDLYVQGPQGGEVSFFTPEVPSGGKLDVDANGACLERMAAPVENIFWPTNGGVPGDYVVSVELFQHCGEETAPVEFTLTTLVRGEVSTYTGSVSLDQPSMSFPFTFSEADAPSEATDAANAQTLPQPNAL